MRFMALAFLMMGLSFQASAQFSQSCYRDLSDPTTVKLILIREYLRAQSGVPRFVDDAFVQAFKLGGTPTKPHASELYLFDGGMAIRSPNGFEHTEFAARITRRPENMNGPKLILEVFTPSRLHPQSSRQLSEMPNVNTKVPKDFLKLMQIETDAFDMATGRMAAQGMIERLAVNGIRLPRTAIELTTSTFQIRDVGPTLAAQLKNDGTIPAALRHEYGILQIRGRYHVEVVISARINLDKVASDNVVPVIEAARDAFMR